MKAKKMIPQSEFPERRREKRELKENIPHPASEKRRKVGKEGRKE